VQLAIIHHTYHKNNTYLRAACTHEEKNLTTKEREKEKMKFKPVQGYDAYSAV